MQLLAHRGLWSRPSQRGSLDAFTAALSAGFGLEIDVRDAGGTLVLSHDPASGSEPCLAELANSASNAWLAVNVKADGLAPLLASVLSGHTRWWAFDMSAPETVRYARAGLPFLTRHSDLEPEPLLYADAAGVWLDTFYSDWFDEATVERHLDAGKSVALVSPELHGREHEAVWDRWTRWSALRSEAVFVCTDRPLELSEVAS